MNLFLLAPDIQEVILDGVRETMRDAIPLECDLRPVSKIASWAKQRRKLAGFTSQFSGGWIPKPFCGLAYFERLAALTRPPPCSGAGTAETLRPEFFQSPCSSSSGPDLCH